MALSAAQKQRLYRQRRDADPERRAKYLKQEKEKYIKDKEGGKKKQVKDMSAREHRKKKREWREYKREAKKRQKAFEKLLTPPMSPDFPLSPPPPAPRHPSEDRQRSRQKSQSRRMRNREKSKMYRKISLLEKQLELEKKRTQMYRKRLQRGKNRGVDTPRSKTKSLLKNFHSNSKKTVCKALTFHFTLMDQLKHNYKNGKKSLSEIAAGEILKKYKYRKRFISDVRMFSGSRLRRKGCLSVHHAPSIRAFFERDDVSRIIPGQKSTVTRKKIKKQRRLLCDTLENLYKKFQSENQTKISFTTFWRNKPFWVTYATEKDRNTCLCKTCENTTYMAEALFKYGIIKTTTLDDLVKSVVCSPHNKTCMYSECEKCKHQKLTMDIKDQNFPISWYQWKTKKEKRILKNGQEKEITITVKEELHGSVGTLCDSFHEHMWIFIGSIHSTFATSLSTTRK